MESGSQQGTMVRVREPAGISTEPGSLGARELARNEASNDYM